MVFPGRRPSEGARPGAALGGLCAALGGEDAALGEGTAGVAGLVARQGPRNLINIQMLMVNTFYGHHDYRIYGRYI